MDEENKNNNIDTNEILKETSNTFNEVKDQVKESFKKEELKNSAKETKNFIVGMFKNPIEELKNIANDSQNSNFKYAIIIVIVWMVAELICEIGSYHYNFGRAILSIIKATIAPLLIVCALSIITMIMNRKKDKGLVTIITVITAAYLPIALASIISILRLIGSNITTITAPFSAICKIISAILLFFGIKFLYDEEDDNKYIRKFVILQLIFCIVAIVARLLGIYIY